MNILAMDSSTSVATVALRLAASGECIQKENTELRQHARAILPMVEALLAEAGLSLSELDAIAFGAGPGSFTGLRIACSLAKGIAYARDLPVYPVNGLEAIALQAFEASTELAVDRQVLSLVDARMDQVYWALYDQQGALIDAQVTAVEAIGLPGTADIVLAGFGAADYLPRLPAAITSRLVLNLERIPKAESLIRLVELGRVQAQAAKLAAPLYVRNQVTHGVQHG